MHKLPVLVLLLSCVSGPICMAEILANSSQGAPSLESILEAAKLHEFGQALDQISKLDGEGPKADKTLVQLLNYYLGAGPSEALAEAITKRGARMLGPLETLRAKAPQCPKRYADLCENRNDEDLNARNEFIDRLISALKSGKILRVES